jgi:hypothetical protein
MKKFRRNRRLNTKGRNGLINMNKYLSEKNINDSMVEVGVYLGLGSKIFSKYFNKVYCVDPWIPNYDNNDVTSNEKELSKAEHVFDKETKDYKNIKKLKMSSKEASKLFLDQSLDFVYIDACHTYKSVLQDITIWLPKIRKGGYIGGHDYDNKKYEVTKAVVEMLGKPEKTFIDMSWIKRVE